MCIENKTQSFQQCTLPCCAIKSGVAVSAGLGTAAAGLGVCTATSRSCKSDSCDADKPCSRHGMAHSTVSSSLLTGQLLGSCDVDKPCGKHVPHTQLHSCSTRLALSAVTVCAGRCTLSAFRAWFALQLPLGVAAAGTAICALMMCPAASRCSAYCGLVRAAARHAALMDVKTGGWSGRVTRQRYSLQDASAWEWRSLEMGPSTTESHTA